MTAPATVIGFDFGLRRIGVAVGQNLTETASPVATLPAKEGRPDWKRVAALLEDWSPAALVVGLPYRTDGSSQPITAWAKRFARQLEGRFGLPVHTIDESLTSRAAASELRDHRRSGRRRVQKPDIDQAAACLLVESWLHSRRSRA
jgi:putative Holliday junction resolvase